MRKLTMGLLALPLLGACGMPAVQRAVPGSPVYEVHTNVEPCPGAIVEVPAEMELTCDVSPPQRLDLLFTEKWWGPGWGGDASVAAAAKECEDSGGRQFWVNDGHYRLICQGVDY